MFAKATTFRFGSLMAIAGFLMAGCGGGSNPTSSQSLVAPAELQPAPASDQRTVAAQGVVRADSNCNSNSGCYSYVLLVPLAIDRQGAFSVAQGYPSCRPIFPWDAPWYISLGSFSLPMSPTSIPACDSVSALSNRLHVDTPISPTESPSPTASPSPAATPSPTPSNLYIARLDISLFSVSVEALSNAGTVSNGILTFVPNAAVESFQAGHLYAFFVAQKVSQPNY